MSVSQASVWMPWIAASELWPQEALIRASKSTGTAMAHSLASATSAQQAASSRRSRIASSARSEGFRFRGCWNGRCVLAGQTDFRLSAPHAIR